MRLHEGRSEGIQPGSWTDETQTANNKKRARCLIKRYSDLDETSEINEETKGRALTR